MLWLRSYPTRHMLSALFCISTATVRDEIHAMIPLFERKLQEFVLVLLNRNGEICRGVCVKLQMLLELLTERLKKFIGPPWGKKRSLLWPSTVSCSSHSSCHWHQWNYNYDLFRVDFSHMNDAQQFAIMQQIGADLEFQPKCFLLAHKIYPNRYPVVTPFSATQAARRHGRDRRNVPKLIDM